MVTGGLSIVGKVGKVVFVIDQIGNAAAVVRGVANMVATGEVTWANAAEAVAGAVGLSAAVTAASRASKAARGAGQGAAVPGACFLAGTLVAVASGFVEIDQLRVGDRVLTTDSVESLAEDDLMVSSWRHVVLTMPNPEAPTDTLDIEVIRPLSWVKELGAAPGGTIEFVLPEMGLWGDATVVRVADCPPIESGPGQVVLATVTHRNDQVYEIRFDAHAEPLYPTARHRLFSVDRGTWIRTDELREGERLLTADGCVSVLSTCRYPGAHRVYNIEVQTEHSYFVGFTRLLSHNVNPCGQAAEGVDAPYKRPSGATTKAQREAVQGKPCVDCGKTGDKMVADHKKPLVEEYYETGTVDTARMRDVDAVQPQCPGCSTSQGGRLSHYSKQKKKELGLE